MPRGTIPERDPVSDTITGSLVRLDGTMLLIIDDPNLPEEADVHRSGGLLVRYGFPYLGKPHRSVVLGLLALDYGEMLTGEQAFKTLRTQYTRYPRADVIGYRNDGVDEMTVAKNLDLALPLHILIYADEQATTPIARADVLIATDESITTLPDRLHTQLPLFDTIATWQAQKDLYDKP